MLQKNITFRLVVFAHKDYALQHYPPIRTTVQNRPEFVDEEFLPFIANPLLLEHHGARAAAFDSDGAHGEKRRDQQEYQRGDDPFDRAFKKEGNLGNRFVDDRQKENATEIRRRGTR
jgi:hypothetical protein